MKNKPQQNGFIVLTAVIILSAVLLLLAHNLSTSSYFQRKGTLKFELKEKSYFLALSCMDIALSKLLKDFEYPGDETVIIETESCYIETIAYEGLYTIVKSYSIIETSKTTLEVRLDQDFNIISFQEQ